MCITEYIEEARGGARFSGLGVQKFSSFPPPSLKALPLAEVPRICTNHVGRPGRGWGSGSLDRWPAPPLEEAYHRKKAVSRIGLILFMIRAQLTGDRSEAAGVNQVQYVSDQSCQNSHFAEKIVFGASSANCGT
jgi:hypothetical protein